MWLFGRKEPEKANLWDEEYRLIRENYLQKRLNLREEVFASLDANLACSVVPQGSYSEMCLKERADKRKENVVNKIAIFNKAKEEVAKYFNTYYDKLDKGKEWDCFNDNVYDIIEKATTSWAKGRKY